jgi:hypothetical protein
MGINEGITMRIKPENVSSARGAPMGRASFPPPGDAAYKVHLQKLRWVGDYDEGGAYWGYIAGTDIYWAHSEDSYIRLYIRASDREEAKVELLIAWPNLKFYK